MGYPLKENDTLEEFRFRVTEDEGLKDTVRFLGLYERLLYSDYEISEVDVADIEREYSELKARLKNKGIRYRFYIV